MDTKDTDIKDSEGVGVKDRNVDEPMSMSTKGKSVSKHRGINIDKERLQLLKYHNFYGNMLYRVCIEYGNKVPTAGVWVDDKIRMCINPEFWYSLTEAQRVGILMHEMDHLIFDHLSRSQIPKEDMKKIESVGKHQMQNIAMDLAINEFNPYLGGIGQSVVNYNKEHGIHMERYREWEYYMKWIEKLVEEGKIPSEAMEGMDDHSKWGSGNDPGQGEVSREIMRQAIEGARSQSSKLPGHLEKAINKLGGSKISWKMVLKRFVARSTSRRSRPTRARRNRRFGLKEPGSRVKPELDLVVIVDTSASVSDKKLGLFATEIEKIAKNFNVYVIESDCSIQNEYKLKKGINIEGFNGRGGTSYIPGLERALEKKADCVIYFGDGDSAPHPSKFKIPMLWCLCTDADRPAPYGSVVRV